MIPPQAGFLSRAAPRGGGNGAAQWGASGRKPDHHRPARDNPVTDSARPRGVRKVRVVPEASAEPVIVPLMILARAPHDTHVHTINHQVVKSTSACRGAGAVVVGLCEHRRERRQNPAYAGRQAPWNVAIGSFAGENEARSKARRPPPPTPRKGSMPAAGRKPLSSRGKTSGKRLQPVWKVPRKDLSRAGRPIKWPGRPSIVLTSIDLY